MRIQVCAVGRIRAGSELDLVQDYLSRFDRTGRALGLGPVQVTEVEDRKQSGPKGEAELLRKSIRTGSVICALDERGKQMTSPEFANQLADWRDHGHSDAAFLIGGADGLAKDIRQNADVRLSFGPMVWPHILARIMLAEQLYRAATILAGTPYHRA